MAEIDRLQDAIERLEQDLAPDDPRWQRRLVDLCHGRDDVEGVRVLMAERGGCSRLLAYLEAFDPLARAFVKALPADVGIDDERLRRVAKGDPWAWWVDPVLPADENMARDFGMEE